MERIVNKHPLAECEKCPLNDKGRFVPSAGPRSGARLAVVGEAPSQGDSGTRIPFSGPGGKLLNGVLEHYGYDRESVFITNATLCRDKDSNTPPSEAVVACNQRLVGELQESGAEVVVTLGNVASQALLPSKLGITQLRVGPGRTTNKLPNVRIIPTFHPTACMRNPASFPSLVNDFGKVDGVHEPWSPPKWREITDVAEALAVIAELHTRGPHLAVDIEAGIDKDVGFGHPNQYDLLCVGVGYERDKVVVFGRDPLQNGDVRRALGDLFRSKLLIMQNGKFDIAGMYPVLGSMTLWFDTMLASYALDERPGIHGLGYMGVEYLGTPNWKSDIAKYVGKGDSYAAIPSHILHQYNAYDVAVTWRLFEYFSVRLSTEGVDGLHQHLVAASNQLVFVELNGLGVDTTYNDQLGKGYLDSIHANRVAMNDLVATKTDKAYNKVGFQINPGSPMQIKEWLHDQGIRVVNTDVDTIELIMTKLRPKTYEHEFLRLLLQDRKEGKLHGTYVKGIRKRLYGGRVFPTFLLHGTTTGRLACRNPNLQNVPRDSIIRRQFVPTRPGNVFVQADYSQAEARVLSWLAGDNYLRRIFNDPTRDLFDELTPQLYGEVAHLNAAQRKELRVRVKAYFYGLNYGREAYSIAQEYNLPVNVVQKDMQKFFALIPEVMAFRDDVKSKVLHGEELVTVFGRHRRNSLITPDNQKDLVKEGLAFLPQSTASDICLTAFTELRPLLRGTAFIRNLVHDSILAECKEEDAEMVAKQMQDTMSEVGNRVVGNYVIFDTDVKIGKNWAEV